MTVQNVRILVVHSDSMVLDSTKRLMGRWQPKWTFFGVQTGGQALDILNKSPVDVIVTDILLEDTDGPSLLKKVRAGFPEVIRIVVTGSPDEGAALASVGLAHQYIQQPYNPEDLRNILERALELSSNLQSKRLKELMGRVDKIPSLPSLYMEVVDKLNSPNVSLKEVGQLISRDPGMSAKVLQLVNSAFFGLYGKIGDPTRATTYLGTDNLKALVFTHGIFSQTDIRKIKKCNLYSFWQHSFAVASISKALGLDECLLDTHCQSDVFTAGILHDVGKLILAQNFTMEYSKIMTQLDTKELWELEEEVFGCNHGEVGAYLLGIWGLPNDIVEAVLFHHNVMDRLKLVSKVAQVVSLADILVNIAMEERNREERLESCHKMAEMVGLTTDLQVYMDKCKDLIEGGFLEGV